MKTGLRCIGFGALMYFFDFNVIVGIRSVDVFPDIVGAFLIIVGPRRSARTTPSSNRRPSSR